MTTAPSSKPSRAPWIVAGVLGCLVVCLLFVIVGAGALAVGGAWFVAGPSAVTRAPEAPVVQITRAPVVANPTVPPPVVALPTPPAQPTQVVVPPTVSPGQTSVGPALTPVPPAQAKISPTLPPAPTADVKATPTQAASKGKIAFSVCSDICDTDDKKSIWIMNADGTGAKKLIEKASEPSFSPDGSQIAYYHYSDGIYIINSDGTDPSAGIPVAQPLEPGQKPTPAAGKKILADSVVGVLDWSHDGRLIAFSSRPGKSGNVSIDVAPPDGTALKDPGARKTIVVGMGAAWAPDDTQFVFNTCRGSTCGIYKSGSAPGSEAVPVVGDNGSAPAWSPDGKKIVYQSEIDGQKQLFLINPDGSGKKQLTSGSVLHVAAAWSLDGNFIYYRSPEGGSWGIWRINADGTNPVKLIDNVPPVDWAFERIAVGR